MNDPYIFYQNKSLILFNNNINNVILKHNHPVSVHNIDNYNYNILCYHYHKFRLINFNRFGIRLFINHNVQ